MLERKQIEGIKIQLLLTGTQHVSIRNIDSLMLLGKWPLCVTKITRNSFTCYAFWAKYNVVIPNQVELVVTLRHSLVMNTIN